MDNVPGLKEAALAGDVQFGTVDTWLLYKFSGGKLHLTEGGNFSATGFYDIFASDLTRLIFYMANIPTGIMPKLVDTAGSEFGSTEESIFGTSIPIRAVMADQAASLFALGCIQQGDMKMTLGTGGFFDCCTGSVKHASINGVAPVMVYGIGSKKVYMAEASNGYTGSAIAWALNMGRCAVATRQSFATWQIFYRFHRFTRRI